MGYVDAVIKNAEISVEGTFDVQEFVDHVREWFEKRGYLIDEKTYLSLPGKTDIKWACVKDYDDYNQAQINVKIKIGASEESKGKKRLTKGKIKFISDGSIERDYKGRWTGKLRMFSRSFYDKFIMASRDTAVKKDLREDMDSLLDSVKQYLNI